MSDNQANKKRKVYHTSSTDATNEAGTVSGHSASRDTSSAPENPPTARIRELRPANFRVGATGRIATPLPHMVNDPYNLNQPGLITRVSAPGGPENPQQSRQAIPRPAPSYGPTRLPPVSYQGSSPYAKRGSKVEIHPDDQSVSGLRCIQMWCLDSFRSIQAWSNEFPPWRERWMPMFLGEQIRLSLDHQSRGLMHPRPRLVKMNQMMPLLEDPTKHIAPSPEGLYS